MAVQITKEQVEKISELVKIPLTDEEKTKLAEMFSDTLKYIEILKELDTEQVKETYQVTGQTNVFQIKEADWDCLSQEEALKNAKEVIRRLVATQAVFDRQ